MLKTYSIVIQPTPQIIEEVRLMKELLASKIGWYNSKNSLAHITINEFEAPETELKNIRKHLTTICQYLQTEEVLFNCFDSFPNGAFFLSPDDKSKQYLKKTMQEIHQTFVYKTKIKSTEPHISIGRRISEDNLKIAFELFNAPNLFYYCNRLALRVFNEERKQFDILEEFVFGNIKRDGEQGTLF